MDTFIESEFQYQVMTSALAEKVSLFETIFAAVREGVLLQDESGIILNVNPAAEELLAASLSELKSDDYIINPTEWAYEDGQFLITKGLIQ